MHILAYPMSLQLSDDMVATRLAVLLHSRANITHSLACDRLLYTYIERLLRRAKEGEYLGGYLADGEGISRVAGEASELRPAVYGDDVALT